MKQQNASSLATLRISTALAMLWALPVGSVSATPIHLTSGRLQAFSDIVFILNLASWTLEGPGFSHSTDGQFEYFMSPGAFPDCPNPPCPATPTVNLSFTSFVSGPVFPAPVDVVSYGGEFYVATGGQVNVITPSAVLGPAPGGAFQLVTLPFTLHGGVHGESPTAGSVDLEFVGGGKVQALYTNRCFSDCSITNWALFDIHYDIEPIPEPTSWMLLGSGLLGCAARRRSGRGNGSVRTR